MSVKILSHAELHKVDDPIIVIRVGANAHEREDLNPIARSGPIPFYLCEKIPVVEGEEFNESAWCAHVARYLRDLAGQLEAVDDPDHEHLWTWTSHSSTPGSHTHGYSCFCGAQKTVRGHETKIVERRDGA